MLSQKKDISVANYNLAVLLEGLSCICTTEIKPAEVNISAVTSDSRETAGGSLFVALAGQKSDGHDFLQQVVQNGCTAIIVEVGKNPFLKDDKICVIEVEETRSVYAEIVAAYYEHPAREMNFIGITGTNGKTTVTYLLEAIFERLSYSVGVIGTVNYRYRNKSGQKRVFPAPFTTPEPRILQKLLREMADEGVRYVVMEVSSHALVQQRLGDVKYDVAAFTNLSHDHLDYHVDMEDYFSAKTRIFTNHLKSDGSAVIVHTGSGGVQHNGWAGKMIDVCKKQKVAFLKTVGGEKGGIKLLKMDARLNGTSYTLHTPQGEVSVTSSLAGSFNVDNGMTAMAIALELGLDVHDAASGLSRAKNVPGRLQQIDTADEKDFKPCVFVDYAHTPDALEKVLQTLQELPHGELICVFGCGGDRDKDKREVMGGIAARLCDAFIITDDNPRTESAGIILQQIAAGATREGVAEQSRSWLKQRKDGDKGFIVHGNREEAIVAAVDSASAADIILIAGKGHEKYQITGEGKIFFDDCLVAGEALSSWTVQSISKALGTGIFPGNGKKRLNDVSTDSRSLQQDDIFVALKGENFDGHAYLQQAIDQGAGAIVMERHCKVATLEKKLPVYSVDDTLMALGNLAGYRRHYFRSVTKPVVVGITGSCGKTTVKEMTASIFEEKWPDGPEVPQGRVLKTRGNFNNLIGLPLSLFPLGARHRAVILEMGMNIPGEITRLAQIADPEISCIVNIHAAHLEGVKSIEGVARAKEELFAGTGPKGTLVINLDDKRVRECSEKYIQKKITFTMKPEGQEFEPDLWVTEISRTPAGGSRYSLHIGELERVVELHVPGEHNIANSLTAAAIAHAAGLSIDEIAAGIGKFRAADKRMVVVESSFGYSIINDTYNANPASMAAGLATLEKLTSGNRIAILGDMLELGAASREAHREIGRLAFQKGVTYLVCTGEYSGELIDGALTAGMDADTVKECNDKKEILAWIKRLHEAEKIRVGDWFLVKASRGRRFETIVEQLVEEL